MRRFLCLFLLAVCAICARPAYATEFVSNRHTARQIMDYAEAEGITEDTSWNITYDKTGKPTIQSIGRAASLMNLYRFVAGTSPVSFNPECSAKAQDAAEALFETREWGHNLTVRPNGWDNAKWESAQAGARGGCVGSGYRTFWRMFYGMIADHTGHNIPVQGHRRWILGEDVAESGAGFKNDASALWVASSKTNFKEKADVAVAWPSAEAPLDLWQEDSPWSISLPTDSDINQVSVTLTDARTKKTWTFDKNSPNLWCENKDLTDGGCVIWRPVGLTPKDGDIFFVNVRGTGAGDFAYTVHFFNAGFAPKDGGWGKDGASSWKPAQGFLEKVNGNSLVHRLYNPYTGEHHYTTDANEYFTLLAVGWQGEGISWESPDVGKPIYRLFNMSTNEHLYTKDEREKTFLSKAGWRYEGVAFHEDESQKTPVYRLFSKDAPGVAAHHYTTDKHEADVLSSLGWENEGVGWFAA